MDPQATWDSLLSEWAAGNWLDVYELAEALLQWLSKDGFPPETMGKKSLGADWNRVQATAMATFALQRANEVLDNPAGIPNTVPFTLQCSVCSSNGPSSVGDALNQGWSHLAYFPAGSSANFQGYCSTCRNSVED